MTASGESINGASLPHAAPADPVLAAIAVFRAACETFQAAPSTETHRCATVALDLLIMTRPTTARGVVALLDAVEATDLSFNEGVLRRTLREALARLAAAQAMENVR